jgi:hypothetical protein
MTARQIIQEIEALPAAEQQEVFVSLQERLKAETAAVPAPSSNVRYLDPETAKPLIKEILTEHAELFRKLAQ